MNIDEITRLLNCRKKKLVFNSPFRYFRNLTDDDILKHEIEPFYLNKIKDNEIEILPIEIKNSTFLFLIQYLNWDSDYFKFPIYYLHNVLFEENNKALLLDAIKIFKTFLQKDSFYCFTNVPSEDIDLLQALTGSNFKLIETRMLYYISLNDFKHDRYKIRLADEADIPNLKRVAREMENPYDRFHADPAFSKDSANEFLATYIENSVKGFADLTIVPAEEGVPPDAFITANLQKEQWDKFEIRLSKMVLSAVSTRCRGWYKKLVSEMAFELNKRGAEHVYLHPASTNRAVIRSYEKLGCRLGQTTHILSYKP